MPPANVTLPDGRTFPVDIPEGMDPQAALKALDEHFTKLGLLKAHEEKAEKPAEDAKAGKPSLWQVFSDTVKEGLAAAEPGQTKGKKLLQTIIPVAGISNPVGRVAMGTGLSMADQMANGRDPSTLETAAHAAAMGITEAIPGGGKLLSGAKKLVPAAGKLIPNLLQGRRMVDIAGSGPIKGVEVPFSALAEAARNPAVRAGVDAAGQREVSPGVPAAAAAVPYAISQASRIPLVGPWIKAAGDMVGLGQ